MSTDNIEQKTDEVIEEPVAEEAPAAEETTQEAPAGEAAPAAEEAQKPDDSYQRLAAEYANFRKRSQKEKDELYSVVKGEAVKKFLPVYDNLERALAQSTDDEAYRKGVEMIMAQFNKTMTELGVSEIESLGKTFDPNLHNAVMHVEDEDKGENEIVEVFQKGFMIGEKVIRFAMVKVAN